MCLPSSSSAPKTRGLISRRFPAARSELELLVTSRGCQWPCSALPRSCGRGGEFSYCDESLFALIVSKLRLAPWEPPAAGPTPGTPFFD